MADIISLNKARKAKALAEAEVKAREGRARASRSKALKSQIKAQEKLRLVRLDAHRRDKTPPDDPPRE